MADKENSAFYCVIEIFKFVATQLQIYKSYRDLVDECNHHVKKKTNSFCHMAFYD